MTITMYAKTGYQLARHDSHLLGLAQTSCLQHAKGGLRFLGNSPMHSQDISERDLTGYSASSKAAKETKIKASQSSVPAVDEAEVAKFSQMASAWWNPRGPMAPLHSMNPIRVKFCRNVLSKHFRKDISSPFPFKGLHIADIGCGGGLLSESLARLGGQVTGIDASREAISIAESHAHADESLQGRVSYSCSTAEFLQTTGEEFDAVVASEIVEHLPDPERFCEALTALTKPDGLVILSTLNRTPRSYLTAILGAERVLRLLPKGTHDWNKFVSPDELVVMMEATGAHLEDIQGMTFSPIAQGWSLSDDLAVNYIASFSLAQVL